MKRSVLLPLVAALVALAPRAYAEASTEAKAAAQQLFDDAGKLMHASQWSEACPKLEASQRLDPGTGTAYRLAYCYAGAGKTASAWALFADVEGAARKSNDKRADDAAAQMKLLEPKLSRLLITVASPAPGQTVVRDGAPVDAGLLGSAVPVDPGEHVIESSAAGTQPWRTSVRVEAAPGTTTVAIPLLVAAAVVAAPEAPPSRSWGAQRIGGVVAGSVGVAGLVTGAILGALALSKNNASKTDCSPANPNLCNDMGASIRADAVALGNGSSAALIVGSAMIVGGIVLSATTPATKKPDGARVELLPGVGRLVLRGTF